jgi:hypothetical protein
MRRGDSAQANRMFRARVLAQGFTVFAMVAGGMYYSKDRERTKELHKLQSQQKAEEKHSKWIKELEARDEEEKYIKSQLETRRKEAEEKRIAAASAEKAAEKAKSSGGVLSSLGGLWPMKSSSPPGTEESADKKPETQQKSGRKENPKSSLGALGEIYGSKKPSDSDKDK